MPSRRAARVALEQVGDVILELGDPLEAGVAGAHEDEGEVLAPRLRVVELLGGLEPLDRLVAQRHGFGQRLEAAAVLGEAGDRQDPRDGAERDDQMVVAEALATPLAGLELDLPQRRIGAGDRAEPDVRPVQLLAQRNHDVARLQRARGGTRQERRVEQEVLLADEGDPRAVAREAALEAPRGIEAAEAPADDYDVRSSSPSEATQERASAAARAGRMRLGSRRRTRQAAPQNW